MPTRTSPPVAILARSRAAIASSSGAVHQLRPLPALRGRFSCLLAGNFQTLVRMREAGHLPAARKGGGLFSFRLQPQLRAVA